MGEVPRHFHTLQLNLFELVDGGRQQRLLGKVKLSRREMLDIGDPLQCVYDAVGIIIILHK